YEEPTYEVERILDDGLINGQRHYHVKWKGFDDTENTWEPAQHFNSKKPLLEYSQRQAGLVPQGHRLRQASVQLGVSGGVLHRVAKLFVQTPVVLVTNHLVPGYTLAKTLDLERQRQDVGHGFLHTTFIFCYLFGQVVDHLIKAVDGRCNAGATPAGAFGTGHQGEVGDEHALPIQMSAAVAG
ncbi:hypothetical protein LTR53_013083, partial [Teratosphaeriaceae sp. CCFEE 6253]